MSNLFSSLLIDPVVRQARRFSVAGPSGRGSSEGALSHANEDDRSPPPHPQSLASVVSQPSSDSVVAFEPSETPNTTEHSQQPPPTAPINIRPDAATSSHRALVNQIDRIDLNTPISSASTPTREGHARLTSIGSVGAMSESLPADDGMRHLRARIHQIRELSIAEEEKARMMHTIMTERYNRLRPQSPSSFVSHDRPFTPTSGQSIFSDAHISSPVSAPSELDPDNPFNLRPGDTEPTYREPPSHEHGENGIDDEDLDTPEDGPSFGCQHYKRNVKVQCFECRRWYTCRHCHDAVEVHKLNRRKTENMLCMGCGTPQSASEHCVHCGLQAAWYYCDICKLWDDNTNNKIYHCPDCGICRKGEGLGKDYVHCKRCNVCISISHADSHRCLERATDCDCPICGENLFDSSSAVVSLPCGHYLHKGCYNLYLETAYKCPMCKKSAVNMELQWRKLTQAIEAQPMPEEFANTRAVIQCNDCSAKSAVKYHWLGNKCDTCDSYNTNEIRLLSGPESEEAANAFLSSDAADSGARSPASAASPSSVPLRSPRYYFQPDQPEETWLPGQLPSFNFQIPQFPGMPQFPGIPQMPHFPGMPQLPQLPPLPPLPPMPQISYPYELMERFSRSLAQYLNRSEDDDAAEDVGVDVATLEIAEEEDAEWRGTSTTTAAADGGPGPTVRLPLLSQYVLERFNRSLVPFRNYINASLDQIPRLDLEGEDGGDPEEIASWEEDIQRMARAFVRGDGRGRGRGEEEDEEDEESESGSGSEGSGESGGEDEDDEEGEEEDEDAEVNKEDKLDFSMPWKP